MKFVAQIQINVPYSNPSGRAYVHLAGIEAFGDGTPYHVDSVTPIRNAKTHLEDVIRKGLVVPRDLQYMIAILWGNEQRERVIDCFGFSGLQPFPHWPGNPEVQAWVLINGVYHHNPEIQRNVTCGDGILILGQEETWRRQCRDLETYLRTPPPIHQVSPVHLVKIE